MKSKRGISLITLVITIVVLLILASIVIMEVTKDNGIILSAREGKNKARIKAVETKVREWQMANVSNADIGNEGAIKTFRQLLDELKDEKLITKEEYDEAMADGKNLKLKDGNNTVTINTEKVAGAEHEKESELPEEIIEDPVNTEPNPRLTTIPVGTIVEYDPTAGVKNPSLLKYTSKRGSARDGSNLSGNGSKDQTFEATSQDNRWIVLKNDNGFLTLISEQPKMTKSGASFNLKGGVGYLYAEEELNKICAIYGHGIGADKSQVTTYKIGNPEIAGEVQTKELKNTGARSITRDDINNIKSMAKETKTTQSWHTTYKTEYTYYGWQDCNRADYGIDSGTICKGGTCAQCPRGYPRRFGPYTDDKVPRGYTNYSQDGNYWVDKWWYETISTKQIPDGGYYTTTTAPINSEPTSSIYMPSLKGINDEGKCQDGKKKSKIEQVSYNVSKSHLSAAQLRDKIFNGNFYLASRGIKTSSSSADFAVGLVTTSNLSQIKMVNGTTSGYTVSEGAYGVRPIVRLKNTVLFEGSGNHIRIDQ